MKLRTLVFVLAAGIFTGSFFGTAAIERASSQTSVARAVRGGPGVPWLTTTVVLSAGRNV